MPPNVGSSAATTSTILSGSDSPISMSKTSMPANFLNRHALPSITGLPASAPMLPSPSTAVPLVMTATRFAARRVARGIGGIVLDRRARVRDARRIRERQVALVGERLRRRDRDLSGRRKLVIFERVAVLAAALRP